MHHGPVDAVLDVGQLARRTEHARVVGLVPGDQDRYRAVGVEPEGAQLAVGGLDRAAAVVADGPQQGPFAPSAPGPGVPEPQRRQYVQRGVIRPAVVHGDLEQNVLGRRLRVFGFDVEVPAVIEDAGVDQLVFGVRHAAGPVDRHQVGVGEFGLRVFVEHPQVRRGRGGVEVEVALLDVLTVVALGVGEPEKPLLQERVALVPQGQRQAHQLPLVTDAGQPVFPPPVGPGTGLVVRERGPGVAAAVVLAHRAPLPLAKVRPPAPPRNAARVRLVQPLPLRVVGPLPLRCCPAASAPRRPAASASALPGGFCSALPGGFAFAVLGRFCSALSGGFCSAASGGFASALPGGFCSALPGGFAFAVLGRFCSALSGGFCSAVSGGFRSALPGGFRSALPGGFRSARARRLLLRAVRRLLLCAVRPLPLCARHCYPAFLTCRCASRLPRRGRRESGAYGCGPGVIMGSHRGPSQT